MCALGPRRVRRCLVCALDPRWVRLGGLGGLGGCYGYGRVWQSIVFLPRDARLQVSGRVVAYFVLRALSSPRVLQDLSLIHI